MNDIMKAAVLYEPYRIAVKEVKKPKIDAGEVLVKIKATGVCGTDVEIYRGKHSKFPLIMGHETSGEVVQVGKNVDRICVGDRVVINPIFYCGKCYFCLMNRRNLCPHCGLLGRDIENGAYAEYVAIPEHMTFKFPERVSYEEATVIQLLTTVYHSQKRIKIMPGDSVAILGQGAAGLLHTRLAKLSGANPIIVTSRSNWKLELAKRYGADITINQKEEDPVKIILNHTNERGADIVIEAVGSPDTLKQAIEVVRPGGVILSFGIPTEHIHDINFFPIYFKEILMVGSRASTGEEFEPSIKLVSTGAVDVKPLITHIFPLEKIKEAFDLIDRSPGTVLRVVIKV